MVDIKSGAPGLDLLPSPPRRQPKKPIVTALLAVLVLCWLWVRPPWYPSHLRPSPARDGRPTRLDESFDDWDAIPPSENLVWVPCFHAYGANFSCARLTVAMDPSRPLSASAAHPKVHVALVLLPGAGHGHESGKFSESPLLLNPGGPGGSGAMFVLAAGPALQKAMAPERDLIGFDPRGIGATWPPADCFMEDYTVENPPTPEARNEALMHRATWSLLELEGGLPNSSNQALHNIVTHSRALAQLCELKDSTESILRFAGTPHVAQDMKSIVEAWDRWRDELIGAKVHCHEGAGGPDLGPLEDGVEPRFVPSTKGKLVYWGFSYGTFLGATFAAMFPESVGRLVLDGVVNSDVYFTKEGWSDSLRDIDTVLEHFFTTCHEAKTDCHLYRDGDQVKDVKGRFTTVLHRLEEDPLVLVGRVAQIPAIVTLSLIRQVLFGAMYFPMSSFPLLGLLTDQLYRGEDMSLLVGGPDLLPLCGLKQKLLLYPDDSSAAIGCSDWAMIRNSSLSDMQKGFERMARRSSFADVFISIMTRCAGWQIKPVHPERMPWDRFPTGDRPPITPAFPILWVSSSHDPVTPLQQALIMSQRFTNSSLIEQLSDGHCSLAAVSLCTLGKIKAYFDEGKVPKSPEIDSRGSSGDDRITGKWVQCKADEKPFKPFGSQGSYRTQEEVDVTEAWQVVRDVFHKMQLSQHRMPKMASNFLRLDYATAAQLVKSQREGMEL